MKSFLTCFASLFFFTSLFISSGAQVTADECAGVGANLTFNNYPCCGIAVVQSATFSGSTVTAAPVPTCGNWGAGKRDIWSRIVVPAGRTQLSFHAFNPSYIPFFTTGSQPCMQIYRGGCGALTSLACFTAPVPGFMANQSLRFAQVNGLIPGETIYMRTWDFNNRSYGFNLGVSYQLTQFNEDNCLTPDTLGTCGCNIFAVGGDVPAPGDPPCNSWTVMDNSVFYTFTVTAATPQPVLITATNTACTGTLNARIQLGIYAWNGVNCTGIGGAGASFRYCQSGTGGVTVGGNLAPGQYMLVVDGESGFGTSLCAFGFSGDLVPLDHNAITLEGKRNRGGVELLWEGKGYGAVSGYEILGAEDGKSAFERISWVQANETAEDDQGYYFFFNERSSGSDFGKKDLFRIKEIGIDGSERYSNVVMIRESSAPEIRVFPNPAQAGQDIQIWIGSSAQAIQGKIVLTNALGKKVLELQPKIQSGGSQLQLPTAALGPGVYFLSFQQGSQRIAQKVVIY